MKQLIKSWLGYNDELRDIQAQLAFIQEELAAAKREIVNAKRENEKLVGECVDVVLSGNAKEYSRWYPTKRGPSVNVEHSFDRASMKTSEIATKRVVEGEAFIDSIVDRINKKRVLP